MLISLANGQGLPREARHHIVTRSDGIPLFVEEMTRTVVESAGFPAASTHDQVAAPRSTAAIPATLSDALTARLDGLGAAKAVAQLGATIGRHFPYDLLRSLWPDEETTLHEALQRLIDTGVVHQRGVGYQATYRFKHTLMRDAAYQGMLKSTRQAYHRQIAQTLEAQCAEIAATQPEVLAYHYTEAGCTLQAVDSWLQAGERALQRSAYDEAVAHLRKGLQVLAILPVTLNARTARSPSSPLLILHRAPLRILLWHPTQANEKLTCQRIRDVTQVCLRYLVRECHCFVLLGDICICQNK